MKTSPVSTASLEHLPATVASLVDDARAAGPVLLTGADGEPRGAVLAFEDAEDAEDWLILNSPEGKASIARGLSDKAAGRVASLADVERDILGADPDVR